MNRFRTSKLFIFIMLVLIFSISAVFAYSYLAGDVGFTPKDSNWDVDNTKDALDDLKESIDRSCNDLINNIWVYPYTGEEQIFSTPCRGYYLLQVWGAQGGNANATYIGGYGAYAEGKIKVNQVENLYVNVGGVGASQYTTGKYQEVAGGYNGGGTASCNSDKYCKYYYNGSGGGATHISKESGLLKDTVNTTNIIIVSGGGNGGHHDSGTPSWSYVGGSAIGIAESGTYFGYGGSNTSIATNAGGGGGYYGGNYGTASAATIPGGSSYLAPALTGGKIYCYNCTASDNVFSATTTSQTPTINTPKQGNGYAKITYLGKTI